MPRLDNRVNHIRHNVNHEGGESLNRFLTVMLQPPAKFRIIDLPTECRLIILKHALGERLYPLSTAFHKSPNDVQAHKNAKVHWGVGFQCASGDSEAVHRGLYDSGSYTKAKDRSVREPNLTVLRLHKQVHQEAFEAGWQNTTKWFFSPLHLQTVLQAGHTPEYN
jgi:hypothetical protein